MKIIKVAIVEDDIRFRKSLRRVIESKPGLTCVAEYGTGAEAIEHIPHDLPEVVLMDLNLPDCLRCGSGCAPQVPTARYQRGHTDSL